MDEMFSKAFSLIDNAISTWEKVKEQASNPSTADLPEEMVERGMEILREMGFIK